MTTSSWKPTVLADLRECLKLLTADGTVPGGVIAHGTFDGEPGFLTAGIVAPECTGARPGPDTLYDAASLTKVLATWLLIFFGCIDIDRPVHTFLPSVPAEAPGAKVTVRQILTHTTGLRAVTRLDQYRGRTEDLAQLICDESLIGKPGASHRYINRGFILAGLLLAQDAGHRLENLAAEAWAALEMTNTTYGPISRSSQVAPTERRLAGAPRLWGIPHDDNAALLGGVAGHAGVFTTAADLATYAGTLLTCHRDGTRLGRWLAQSMVPQVAIEPGLDRGLAWILADDGQVAYHHGFTGTSLYLAPRTGRYLAICTNAVYHHEANRTRLAPLRALALKAITAEP
ncbi:serine hydrolase domain-containing protein [Kitasatospora sp. NBC_01302]|uniref:serine hydrolase domain-containing protein n=1 Tax=Kitasatospora sp. NBC_01302 TaxID=2903575 RepID=UPI002E10EC38|nr:beta-lactamase family protein [Kitasatospora sp. NBC_01302]